MIKEINVNSDELQVGVSETTIATNFKGEEYNFECKISGFIIKYNIDNSLKIAIMDFANFEEKFNKTNIKAFFLILRTSIEQIKKKRIDKIYFLMTNEDYELLKEKTSWTIVNSIYLPHVRILKDIFYVQCDINDALENVGIGFGLETIYL